MMEEWVDDCWNDMEVQIMALAGNEFKHLALTPFNSSTTLLTCSTKEDAALHAIRSKRRDDARMSSMHMRGARTFSHYAALAKRNSERYPACERQHFFSICNVMIDVWNPVNAATLMPSIS